MQTQHTPGPWDYYPDTDQVARVGGACIADVKTHYLNPEENGRLIAAAPELLSALIAAVELIEVLSPIEGDVLRHSRAAIDKAVGHNAQSSAAPQASAGMKG